MKFVSGWRSAAFYLIRPLIVNKTVEPSKKSKGQGSCLQQDPLPWVLCAWWVTELCCFLLGLRGPWLLACELQMHALQSFFLRIIAL